MMGTMFCQYETPCGWCTRLNKECTEKGGCKPKTMKAAAVAVSDAMSHPMVKAYAAAQEEFKSGLMRGGA